MKELKVLVIGSQHVGKSSLVLQFVQNEWIPDYSPTIQENYRKTIQVDNELYSLDILDTAGSEEYSHMRDLFVKQCHGIICVFDICDENSFTTLKKQIEHIILQKEVQHFPFILVGNKSDYSLNRSVSKKQAIDFAANFNTIYIETSAMLNINVNDTFTQLIRSIIKPNTLLYKKNREQPSTPQPPKSILCAIRNRLLTILPSL